MFRTLVLSAAALLAAAPALDAQYLPRRPIPLPPAPAGGVEGVWYFRGDPFAPCSVQQVQTRRGVRLYVVNEKGTPAEARLLWDGRTLVVPDWNLRGDYRGNAIVWPNGDFWAR